MIRIIQCLCPKRHAIFGIAYDPKDKTDEMALADAQNMFVDNQINPWCVLCKSRDLVFEVGVTPFQTMKEALPHIKACEEAQMRTRAKLLAELN